MSVSRFPLLHSGSSTGAARARGASARFRPVRLAGLVILVSAALFAQRRVTLTSPNPIDPGLPPLPASVVRPALPQATVNTAYPTVTGESIAVHSGGNLQDALNSANCGDEVVLDAGAAFSGNFLIPGKPCSAQPILVRSSAISSLPPGLRVSPANVTAMATISTPNAMSVLNFTPGTAGWHFAGLEFTVAPGVQGLWNLITVAIASSLSQLPADIVFDRVYVHANEQMCVRGFLADALGFGLVDSYVSGFSHNYADTQAALVSNAPGPYLFQNDYLEAAGENLMFGGGDACANGVCTGIPGSIPSDITITGNYFSKQYALWNQQPAPCGGSGQQQCYDVKNALECKMCQRVLIDANVFSYSWCQGQSGQLIQIGPRTGCGSPPGPTTCPDPQAVANDITIIRNLFQHAGSVIALFGVDNYGQPYVTTQSARGLVRNNIAIDISAPEYGANGEYGSFGAASGVSNWTWDHNTIVNDSVTWGSMYLQPPVTDSTLTYTNNIAYRGLQADSMTPSQVLASMGAGSNLSYDAFVGDWTQNYPASAHFWEPVNTSTPVSGRPACNQQNNPSSTWPMTYGNPCWALDWAQAGFVDFTGGSSGTNLAGLVLSNSSPLKSAGSDGADLGADVAEVIRAISAVVRHRAR